VITFDSKPVLHQVEKFGSVLYGILMANDVKEKRSEALQGLTNDVGVYALCDLDGIPLYIGQSADGIRLRVQRHLTSARSDVIANRQLDIWEVSEVWGWPLGSKLAEGSTKAEKVQQKKNIDELENFLIHFYNEKSPLVNGKLPAKSASNPLLPEKQVVKIMW
jgi:excinuclease UvrABC nuclease subunit